MINIINRFVSIKSKNLCANESNSEYLKKMVKVYGE